MGSEGVEGGGGACGGLELLGLAKALTAGQEGKETVCYFLPGDTDLEELPEAGRWVKHVLNGKLKSGAFML